jgi:hypothetical protein
MVDVHPDDLKNFTCDFPALFYVDPKDYRPGVRTARQRWVIIPGKHRKRDAALNAQRKVELQRPSGNVCF